MSFFKSHANGIFTSNMGENVYIYPFNVKALKGLIEKDHLGKALELLKKWAEDEGKVYENEVINLKRRLNEMRRLGRSGSVPLEKILQLSSQLAKDLLDLLDEIDEDDFSLL